MIVGGLRESAAAGSQTLRYNALAPYGICVLKKRFADRARRADCGVTRSNTNERFR